MVLFACFLFAREHERNLSRFPRREEMYRSKSILSIYIEGCFEFFGRNCDDLVFESFAHGLVDGVGRAGVSDSNLVAPLEDDEEGIKLFLIKTTGVISPAFP